MSDAGRVCRVSDELAERAALRRQNLRQPAGQFVERNGGREQGVEPAIGKQIDGGGKRRRCVRPRTVRGRDAADLTGDKPEAPAVKSFAERRGDVTRAIPTKIQNGRLCRRQGQARRQARGGPARVDDKIAISARRRRRRTGRRALRQAARGRN